MRARNQLLAVSVAATMAACILSTDTLPGAPCRSDQDCPAQYQCVPMLPDGGMTCQVQYPYGFDAAFFDSGIRDAGGNVDAGMDSGTTLISFAVSIQPIFDSYCVSCHGGATPAAGQDLTSGHSYASIVNVPCVCDGGDGLPRIKPSDPNNSEMILKTEGASNACGASMPKGDPCGPLNQFEPALWQQLSTWVSQGAMDN